MAQDPPEIAGIGVLRKTLLGPLRFAAGDDFARLARVRGLESLVRGAVDRAGDTVAAPLRDAILQAAIGLDADEHRGRAQRVRALLALLEGAPPLAAGAARQPSRQPSRRALPTQAAAKARGTKAPPVTTTPAPEAVPPRGGSRAAPVRAPAPKEALDTLALPVTALTGVGPRRAMELVERGLCTVGDVLFTVPRTWQDRRQKHSIGSLAEGMLCVVSGRVAAAGPVGFARGRRFEAILDDGTGQLKLVFFHFRQGEMQKRLARGAVVTVSGEVTRHGPRLTLVHPMLTAGENAEAVGGLKPVYPELKGLHPAELARVAAAAMRLATQRNVDDPLPAAVRSQAKVPGLLEALTALHDPREDLSVEELRALLERRSPAHRRLAFEELFVLGTALALRRRASGVDPAPTIAALPDEEEVATRMLPFALTGAQQRACREILQDLARPVPMARLLQGDVGAGKTAVAAVAALRAARAGFQTAFMAPTEILAEQHGRTLKKLGFQVGLRVEVLTGSLGKKARTLLSARIKNRDVDVVVGTQALLSDDVQFARLGLVIVDEQHRFGVVQRALLRKKGASAGNIQLTPHLLVMTATPIPRSLALTVYGDLVVSVLDELPPGRTPVATRATSDMGVGFDAIRSHIARNERAFVVYPLIDESETLDVAAATAGFDDLVRTFGPHDVALLHGRMSTSARDEAMARFARGEVRVLVSTTVIEVGVDVPEATLMVIANAERFGLAQLHQLRGRVGRSARKSSCLLVVGAASQDAMARVRILEEQSDGFAIAEADLEQRGPGDVLGTRQSGLPSLAFADLVRHAPIIELARTLADAIVDADPHLAAADNAGLKRLVFDRYASRLALTAGG